MADHYQKYLEEKHQKFNTPESLIEDIVKEATNSSISSKQKLLKGEENEVYEITTLSNQKVVVRIHRGKHNAFLAEQWAIERCLKLQLPVPKILLIKTIKNEPEDLHFCVQEFLTGDTLERGNIDFHKLNQNDLKKLINQAGEILSKIHSIPTNGVGWLNEEGKGIYDSQLERFENLEQKLSEIYTTFKAINLDPKLATRILKILKENLSLYDKYPLVLNHGDYSPKHIMVEDNKITGILDFGGVCSEPGIYDFFWWDYWYGNDLPISWLKEGYGNKALFDEQFDTLLKVYRIHRGLELLLWYFSENYMPAVNKAKNKLLKDLRYFS